MKIAGAVDSREGLGFPTVEQFLRYIRNRWEEALPRNPTVQESDTAELELAAEADEVVLTLVSAWNQHDMKAWADCFAEDAEYLSVSGTYWHGRAEIEANLGELHRSVFRDSRFRPVEWTIRMIASQAALVHLTWRMKEKRGLAGWIDRETRRGILTLVLERSGDRWLIRSAHNTDMLPVPAKLDR
jgi:uncharacterized protein (TIGR02246 family)